MRQIDVNGAQLQLKVSGAVHLQYETVPRKRIVVHGENFICGKTENLYRVSHNRVGEGEYEKLGIVS